jgi:CRISPR-associated endonuclease/helicase Cas3
MNVETPWGKYDARSGTSHHLAHHCADVAACFAVIARQPAFRARLESSAGRELSILDLERLQVLVFLHDAGKLRPGFQAKAGPAGRWLIALSGHVREGLELFIGGEQGIAESLYIDALSNWGVQQSLLAAVISHHGRPCAPRKSLSDITAGWAPVGGYNPRQAAAEMGALMPKWFDKAFAGDSQALPDTPAFEHLICGLATLADWLGSDARYFPHIGKLDCDYMTKAMAQAEYACAAVGIDVGRQRALLLAPGFAAVTGHIHPNRQQLLIGSLGLDQRLVILEAETGSGKTEAALWRYAQLFEAGKVDSLYFAVPTRAAAVQLQRRVHDAARRLFGDAVPQTVLAIPGYLRAGEAEGTPLPDWRVLWDDEGHATEARWAAEQPKRYLAAPIAVGTIDQAMLGALKVKHAHLRAGSLSRSLLVIDEVHASDRYMTTVQKRLLDGHLAVGGYAMLMSATLGSVARSTWLNQPRPSFDQAIGEPYPAVWMWGRNEPVSSQTDEKEERRKRVTMTIQPAMAPGPTAECALRHARAGARVLVIRNTVERAVETLETLEALTGTDDSGLLFRVNGRATLHHSRFAPNDRRLLDAAVEQALTKEKDRTPRGLVVIGTQTLEQSLDIDADILITDLCPVDVLLQRIGRLHRHQLARPVHFKEARCVVLVPETGLEPLLAPRFDNGLGAWRENNGVLNGIYRDVSVLELTRSLIVSEPVWIIPDMNRRLVEGATHPHQIEILHETGGPAWEIYHRDILGKDIADALGAQGVLIDRCRAFGEPFPDAEERIRTRLGEEGMRLALAEPHPKGPFGAPIEEVVLPAHWSRGVTTNDEPVAHDFDGDTLMVTAGERTFRYDRVGLMRQRGPSNESADRRAADGRTRR